MVTKDDDRYVIVMEMRIIKNRFGKFPPSPQQSQQKHNIELS